MQIYFSARSVVDQNMMNEIKNIHDIAMAQFKLDYLTEEKLQVLNQYKLEITLSSRLKVSGGRASFHRLTGKVKVEINYKLHLKNMNELKDTYLHELGHAIDYLLFASSSHGYRWKNITAALGGSTARTHKMDTSEFKRKKVRYNYSCGCQIHTITAAKHNKILRGYGYRCVSCKNTLVPLSQDLKRFVPEKLGADSGFMG